MKNFHACISSISILLFLVSSCFSEVTEDMVVTCSHHCEASITPGETKRPIFLYLFLIYLPELVAMMLRQEGENYVNYYHALRPKGIFL